MKQQNPHHDPLIPPPDAVWFLPLGGAGEIGMNLGLYGTNGRWLMVDCGLTFPDDQTPGIEVIMPDVGFIAQRRDLLDGIVITHGHEDHLGAIMYLWPSLRCPVYATRFAAEILRAKLVDVGLEDDVPIIEIPSGGAFTAGSFDCAFVPVTHSIPESQMLVLRTPHGIVVHTGDWKLDSDPVVGPVTDVARLESLGREGVLAVISNSTNALVPGISKTELSVQQTLERLFPTVTGRLVLTCFSSHVARVHSAMKVAEQCGRTVALVGRSLRRNAGIGADCGYLPLHNTTVSDREIMRLPPESAAIIVTGGQGEVRAALSRIAAGQHPTVRLDPGDTVIFSARVIPGNEHAVGRVQNLLTHKRVHLVTPEDAQVHVSGHPPRGDLEKLYAWLKPRLVVPVHGELRHQVAHARLAEACGVVQTLTPHDGALMRLGPGPAEIIAEVPTHRLALEGTVLKPLAHTGADQRFKLGRVGAVVLTVVVDGKGRCTQPPRITLLGLEGGSSPDGANLRTALGEVAEDSLRTVPQGMGRDDEAIRKALMKAIRAFLRDEYGREPLIETHIIRAS